jgi:hypothetical protein
MRAAPAAIAAAHDMGASMRSRRAVWTLAFVSIALTMTWRVVTAADPAATKVPAALLDRVSQSVTLRYWMAHPEQAPRRVALALKAVKTPPGRHVSSCTSNANKDVFNCDIFGLPQNEESISACPTNDNFVLGGTNDYRGLIDPEGNFTGWHWSIDGGHSVQNEGLLPPVTLTKIASPHQVPSGGDPVDFVPAGCDAVYAASLAFDPNDPFGQPNGLGVYRSTPAILSSCQPFTDAGFTNPACWPDRSAVAQTEAGDFIDKPWMFVGVQNGVRYVWATYSDFVIDNAAPLGYSSASIKAVRCDETLQTCTEPIQISTVDDDVQFSDVTIGPDGRTYITWARIDGELNPGEFPEGQVFTIKYRSETAPGSAVFGPERVVQVVPNAIPFGGFIHSNDFRVATYPKSDVVRVNGHPRAFVIYDECTTRLFGSICEYPQIKLTYSDDDGVTWSPPIVLSDGGDNYFPSISADRTATTNNIAAAWYTNSRDIGFANQQDVFATSINPLTGQSRGLKRLTSSSNETESDPLLGGVFIGDYIEGVLIKNTFYVHTNANYRKVPFLGGFLNEPNQPVFPVNQQDNYLAITGLN